jgi:hypothetical protein
MKTILPTLGVCFVLGVLQVRAQAASGNLSTISSNRTVAAAVRLLRQGVSSNGGQVVTAADFQARIASKAASGQLAQRGANRLSENEPVCVNRSDMVAWWRGCRNIYAARDSERFCEGRELL